MGLFDKLFSNNSTNIKEMSDAEIIRKLKRNDLDIASRARLIKEAKERGLDIPSF